MPTGRSRPSQRRQTGCNGSTMARQKPSAPRAARRIVFTRYSSNESLRDGFLVRRELMKSFNPAWLLIAAGAALTTYRASAADDWARNFRIGIAVGLNIRADFKMGGQ